MAGYLKGTEPESALKTLRRERNILVHNFLPKQTLSEDEFEEKWCIASKALNILTDRLSSAGKSEIDLSIEAIENTYMDSLVDPIRGFLCQPKGACANAAVHHQRYPRCEACVHGAGRRHRKGERNRRGFPYDAGRFTEIVVEAINQPGVCKAKQAKVGITSPNQLSREARRN